MAKETVRYPDDLVARIESFVTDSSAFESKSEYHRFASEFLLSRLDPDHRPSVLGYHEIFTDLEADLDDAFDPSTGTDEPFLQTYIRVRRHLLRSEFDEARAVVDGTYDVADREALLLDEMIARTRTTEVESGADGRPDRHSTRLDTHAIPNGRSYPNEVDEPTGSRDERDSTADEETSAATGVAEEPAVESEH